MKKRIQRGKLGGVVLGLKYGKIIRPTYFFFFFWVLYELKYF